MNRRGDLSDSVMMNYVLYFILLVVFTILMFYFITGFQEGAFGLEDIYAKALVRIIDSSEPGQEIYIDVTELTVIAFKNKKGRSDIFNFDNVNNKITVSLRKGSGTSFNYFNEVDVVGWDLEVPSPGAGPEVNRLYFKIAEAAKNE
mgnify:CR=1 FL=1